LRDLGLKVVVIRHPMPYGDLNKQIWQRFATYKDLDRYNCTIEEREEYEPHINRGVVVYAGVDYREILQRAEKEADVILWDGGNNDFSFYRTDLYITVVDPLRAGDELTYYPGETNVRLADVVIINKIDTAYPEEVELVRANVRSVNPKAAIIDAASPLFVERPAQIKGKRVLVIEDGPTVTHGEMEYGAGFVAAVKYGAKEIMDPRPFAVGSIKQTFEKYDHITDVLPAMGYSDKQRRELQQTINDSDCELVVSGTPIDISRILKVKKKIIRVKYDLQVIGRPDLVEVLQRFVKRNKIKK